MHPTRQRELNKIQRDLLAAFRRYGPNGPPPPPPPHLPTPPPPLKTETPPLNATHWVSILPSSSSPKENSNKLLFCLHCPPEYTCISTDDLRTHALKKNHLLYCNCRESFTTPAEWREHNWHRKHRLACSECRKVWESVVALREHMVKTGHMGLIKRRNRNPDISLPDRSDPVTYTSGRSHVAVGDDSDEEKEEESEPSEREKRMARVEAIDIHQDGAPNVDHKHKDNETGEKSGKHEACSVGPPYRPGGKGLVTLWVGRRRNFQELTPDDVETPSLKRSKANATKFRSDGFSRL